MHARRRRGEEEHVSPSDDRADRHGVGLKCREARGATRGSRPVGLRSRPPRSTARRRAALTHYTLHTFAISTSLSGALTAVERLTVDGQYLIAQHGPFLTAHGQESGTWPNLTAQGLTVDNRPALLAAQRSPRARWRRAAESAVAAERERHVCVEAQNAARSAPEGRRRRGREGADGGGAVGPAEGGAFASKRERARANSML